MGYELSPFLWRKVKRGLSAGRVQSVATRLVVDRENEIRAFVPEEYWTIEALLQTADGGQFTARYYGDGSGKAELKNEAEAQAVVDAVKGKPFVVGEIKRGKKKRTPAAAVHHLDPAAGGQPQAQYDPAPHDEHCAGAV